MRDLAHNHAWGSLVTRPMSQTSADRLRVFVVCSGIGHVRRGFESFAQELGEALDGEESLRVRVFGGRGEGPPHYRTVPCIPRESRSGRALQRLVGRNSYSIEQGSFVLGLLPHIFRHRPHVIVYSDPLIGNALWRIRSRCGLGFVLLLSNGAPFIRAYPRFDHVQQVSPEPLELAIRAGIDPERQTLLPYGFKLEPELSPLSREDKRALRLKLGLPGDGRVLVSVGSLDCGHKRMDYLVAEIAAVERNRPHVLLLGETHPDTPAIRELAHRSLGAGAVTMRTVRREEVADYLRASDLFALCSLREGFGRVLVEALAAGLRTIAHDAPVFRYVVDDVGELIDMAQRGSLARAVAQTFQDAFDARRHQSVYARFSWTRLQSRYVEMLRRAAEAPRRSARG